MGDAAVGPTSVVLGNAGLTNLWTLPVDFGSRLRFTVAFSGAWEGAAPGDGLQLATSLYASLLDLDYGQLLTTDPAASVLRMDLFPGGGVAVDLSGAAPGVASVAAVPEPESAAMVLAGLGLLGLLVRRRRRQVDTSVAKHGGEDAAAGPGRPRAQMHIRQEGGAHPGQRPSGGVHQRLRPRNR